MLKIKDNVDLKELEKFGFEYHEEKDYHYESYSLMEISTGVYIIIYGEDRIIRKGRWSDSGEYDTILFDLIQAGLVEKVEEE